MVSHTNLRLPGTVQGRWLLSCCKRTSVYSQYSFFFSNVIFVEAVVRMYIPPFPSPLGSEQPFSSVILFCFCNLLYVMGVLTRFIICFGNIKVFFHGLIFQPCFENGLALARCHFENGWAHYISAQRQVADNPHGK